MVHHLDQREGESLLPSRFSSVSSCLQHSSMRNKLYCYLTGGMNLKWLSLIVLILQTTVLVLTLHYSRVQKSMDQAWKYVGFINEVYAECYIKSQDALKMAVPAFLYVVQNNFLFLALSKLDAATYQLPKDLGKVASSTTKSSLSSDSDKMVGLFSVIAACFLSGFAGVYFEKVLKSSSVSLWMRNLQLAFFSIFGGFFMVWFYDFKQVNEYGFFQGYNSIIWIVVLLQAYGGLVVALVVKYADNILKGFAVSLSIVLSSLISYWLLDDFQPSLQVFCLKVWEAGLQNSLF
ncbi:UDP-N-acetylglucosamine transporter [Dirofilaria immitis]|nr:UDP-N-acetylglucosamine transporter [Dirofilaria immitis]